MIDYRDILESDNEMQKFVGHYEVRDNNNSNWIKDLNIDGEGRIKVSRVYPDKNSNVNIFYDDLNGDLYKLKLKRDVVDLFSLIYSKELIESFKTGPFSSWTDYVLSYRDNICQE